MRGGGQMGGGGETFQYHRGEVHSIIPWWTTPLPLQVLPAARVERGEIPRANNLVSQGGAVSQSIQSNSQSETVLRAGVQWRFTVADGIRRTQHQVDTKGSRGSWPQGRWQGMRSRHGGGGRVRGLESGWGGRANGTKAGHVDGAKWHIVN